MGAEPEPLDCEGAKAEISARLVQLGAAEDVHALAVCKVEPEAVELSSRHGDREAGAALRVLEREENGLPALPPAQLGDLAFHPDCRQPAQPARDAAVEGGHRVDLPVAVFERLDLHR